MNHLQYAPGAFKPDGSLRAVPPEEVAATLGKYGMVHPFVNTETLRTTQQEQSAIHKLMLQAQDVKSKRVLESLSNFLESSEGKRFIELYENIYSDTSKFTSLVGEEPPRLENSPFLEQVPSLMESYRLFEELDLKPQLVLAPRHRSEEWWKNLCLAFQESPLNPSTISTTSTGYIGLVRNGGLLVSGEVSDEWDRLTGHDSNSPSWSLSVMSTTSRPYVTDITSYGCDRTGRYHKDFSELISKLCLPISNGEPFVQPDIHPDIETYITYQFTPFINNPNQDRTDITTWSWLSGKLESVDGFPVGQWMNNGMVYIGFGYYYYTEDNVGIRPTARSTIL